MRGFEDVTISWRGVDYNIPAKGQMMLIAKLEDALSGDSGQQAMTVLFRKEGPPYSRLAAAFGAALRHAGAKATDEEIYLSMQADLANRSKESRTATIQNCILALLSIISPPTFGSVSSSEPAAKKT